ncbi:uncharacterized protein LAESUDRAFT_722813 [Laetiporus sulphureus 93-53]|uniref:Zn(2)-C6 fungal-type domain-containing protein n=1 Tax=Laetiporus sulphureus 93-53 TaxID=1314785 RepID=A0A165FKJ3_9APHY|nr:uncharacterized protein LAESUDRAFT_722813 [Laetiporus sulphureus 93-53]KZT09112.1 hypothetical protein LAESUDRAFT_722813 [Laetiporus sulphureus 93-53]
MDVLDHRAHRDDIPLVDGPYPLATEELGPPHSIPSGSAPAPRMDGEPTGYTLMVAGRRSGKTSFLRLLLDTSCVSHTVTMDQLASVAKFVQGCSGHTSHVRTVSIDVTFALDDADDPRPLNLTLIDTPSLDFDDEPSSQRAVAEILRHVDARFAESVDDERKAQTGHHHVHLCIYFLDPESIVPPSVSAPPVPIVARARTNSLSMQDSEPVILEPPVTTNPLLCRPTLPAEDIATIRRLSARVNVLPVVARADMLTNDRLAAVKMAIRRDLAEAGIGFGIFDLDTFPQYPQYQRRDSTDLTPKLSEPTNGYASHTNGASSTATSPPSTPMSPSFLRLPFALISPDIYSHSDGVSRPTPSRHELALQYTPLQQYSNGRSPTLSKIVLGKFTRSYRWGFLDVMDVNHCDFVYLRGAIFHHMQTLQKYTREYLLQKFRAEVPQPLHSLPPTRAAQPSMPMPTRLPPLSQASRPILAIDTTHGAPQQHLPSQPVARPSITLNGDGASPPVMASQPTAMLSETSPATPPSTKSQRGRAKKITVACNFCRSRKLKCDGGRPACSQCFKRSHPCDYTTSNKRRGNAKSRKQFGGSESEGESLEEQSTLDMENASQSPEVVSQTPSRRNSNVSMLLTESLPPLSSAIDRADDQSTVLPPITNTTSMGAMSTEARPELPPIVTLSVPPASMQREDPAGNGQMTQRRRASSAASGRPTGRSSHGSKIVACNVCRARKTRCDGAHPTCGSCARRSLACSYVNDPSTSRSRGSRGAGVTPGPSTSTSSRSSPTAPLHFTSSRPLTPRGYTRTILAVDMSAADQVGQPMKKMRMADDGRATIAVAQAP